MSYSTTQAARLLNIAPSSIRNYTHNPAFSAFFSPGATPAPGAARVLSGSDLRVLRFIASQTSAGSTLVEVAERLANGEHKDLPPLDAAPQQEQQPLALALVGQLDAAHNRETALLRELAETKERLARAEQELSYRRRSLWSRLFGL